MRGYIGSSKGSHIQKLSLKRNPRKGNKTAGDVLRWCEVCIKRFKNAGYGGER